MRIFLVALLVAICLSIHVDHQWFWSNRGIEGSWKLVRVNGNPVVGNYPTSFKSGRFALKYCNNMNGPYALEGTNRLRFKGIASTMMACFGQNPTEGVVSSALTNTQGYQLAGNNLNLFDGFGRPTLSFIR